MSNSKQDKKVVTIKIKDIQQLKIILSTWYSYLLNKLSLKTLQEKEFQESVKTPIMYNIEKDELELLLYGTEEMLKELNSYVQDLNKEIIKKRDR
ncbi:MAG: hypothetical protein ACK4UJ_05060 [Leptonema sp. (in: bacteria)]